MTYSKPELLSAEAALDAIRGVKDFGPTDGEPDVTNIAPAYEVDE